MTDAQFRQLLEQMDRMGNDVIFGALAISAAIVWASVWIGIDLSAIRDSTYWKK